MFSCCWPKKKAQKPSKALQQKLIEKESKPAQVTFQMEKPPQVQQKKQMPANSKLQEMEKYNSLQLNISISTSNKYQPQEIHPSQNKIAQKRARLGSFQQVQKVKKKSELWEEEAGTKILYFNQGKEQEMMFAFKITHTKTHQSHPLSYTLNPHKNSHKIRSRPLQMSLNLIVLDKNATQAEPTMKSIQNDIYSRNVFGLYKRQKNKAPSFYDNDEIIEMGANCIRVEVFDRVIIYCLNEKHLENILHFCQKITQSYELQQFSKVIFVFPMELTLSEISLVLSKLLRKHLISEKLQSIVKYLGLQVELVEGDKVQPFIVVKSNLLMNEQEIYSKQFEVKLQLSIGLLMIEINYNNFKTYQKVLDNFFVDMTVIKYLKMIQFIHKEKKTYLSKLQELNLFQPNQLLEIQNSTKMEEKIISQVQKCIVIKQKVKKRMGELFTDYRTAHTPVEELQSKKKEWDDDLKEQDIKVIRTEKPKLQNQENYNIFEAIADSDVENASLDILTGIEFRDND